MDRFAFKIDKALKANLYKICRLCGIDQFEKVPILVEGTDEIILNEHEPPLQQKIVECLGLLITKDDKMPQTICTSCVDKLNDFYEFREMCYATDVQARKLLGFREPKTEKALSSKSDVEIKHGSLAESLQPLGKRLRSGDKHVPITKKNRLSDKTSKKKAEPLHESCTKKRCMICEECFSSKWALEKHQAATHAPKIDRQSYFRTTCKESICTQTMDQHQQWNESTETPFTCPLCKETILSFKLYSMHMLQHTQSVCEDSLVSDRECPQCQETFVTNFLYNTHPCVNRTKICGGCDQKLNTENEYMRHAATCPKIYHNSTRIPDAADCADIFIANVRRKKNIDPLSSTTIKMEGEREDSDVTYHDFHSGEDENDNETANHNIPIKIQLAVSNNTQKEESRSYVHSKSKINAKTDPMLSLNELCNICDERFCSKFKLERHQATTHIPSSQIYFCTTCNKSITKGSNIRDHQLWHKKSKVPHTCPLCEKTIHNFYTFSEHIRDHSVSMCGEATVLEQECPLCREIFATQFLYNTHVCAVRTKTCAGCEKSLSTEKEYKRHAAKCPQIYRNYASIRVTDVLAESFIEDKNAVGEASEDEEYNVNDFDVNLNTDTTAISVKYEIERVDHNAASSHDVHDCDYDCHNWSTNNHDK